MWGHFNNARGLTWPDTTWNCSQETKSNFSEKQKKKSRPFLEPITTTIWEAGLATSSLARKMFLVSPKRCWKNKNESSARAFGKRRDDEKSWTRWPTEPYICEQVHWPWCSRTSFLTIGSFLLQWSASTHRSTYATSLHVPLEAITRQWAPLHPGYGPARRNW